MLLEGHDKELIFQTFITQQIAMLADDRGRLVLLLQSSSAAMFILVDQPIPQHPHGDLMLATAQVRLQCPLAMLL